MSYVSYSELNTFKMCNLQHFFRYFFRLASRNYSEKRALYVGSMTHDSIEHIYDDLLSGEIERRALTNAEVRYYVGEAAKRIVREYEDPANAPYKYDEYDFAIDQHLAVEMVKLFAQRIFPSEEYKMITPEYSFELPLAGKNFLGYIDGVVSREPTAQEIFLYPEWAGKILVFPSEVKTWAMSRSVTKLEDVVREDLQTDIYSLALIREGKVVGPHIDAVLAGKLYTVYRKPPSKYMKRQNYPSLNAQMAAITDYYENVSRNPFKRVEVLGQPDAAAIEASLKKDLSEIDEFYEDPFEAATWVDRPSPDRFPCNWCEFKNICHVGIEPGPEFRYKSRRKR